LDYAPGRVEPSLAPALDAMIGEPRVDISKAFDERTNFSTHQQLIEEK